MRYCTGTHGLCQLAWPFHFGRLYCLCLCVVPTPTTPALCRYYVQHMSLFVTTFVFLMGLLFKVLLLCCETCD
jgi:hypothetical protein